MSGLYPSKYNKPPVVPTNNKHHHTFPATKRTTQQADRPTTASRGLGIGQVYNASPDAIITSGWPPCMYRDEPLRKLDCGCQGNRQTYRCIKFDAECTQTTYTRKAGVPIPDVDVRICSRCDAYLPLSAHLGVEGWIKYFRDGSAAAFQPAFAQLQNCRTGFIRALREEMDRIRNSPEKADKTDSSVIIICGMGGYFVSTYVTAAMCRALGWRGPIEVYCLAHEYQPWQVDIIGELDVSVIACTQDALRPGVPMCGWSLKGWAAMYTSHRRVLYLDADSYPVHNPSEYFALLDTHPAAFWTDPEKWDLKPHQWAAFGLNPRNEPAWEAGQWLMDTVAWSNGLRLFMWLCARREYVWEYVFGDKDTFHIVERLCDYGSWVYPGRPVDWHDGFIQCGPDGTPWFVHRIGDKFRAPEERRNYYSQQKHVEPRYYAHLPCEDLAWEQYRRIMKRVYPLRTVIARPPDGE